MNYKLEKILAWIKWVLAIILVDVILRVYCILFYPLGYLFRTKLRSIHNGKKGVLWYLTFLGWILLNDGNSKDVGYSWFHDSFNLYPTTAWNRFKLAYLWNPLRNPCWNAYDYINPKQGEKTDIDVVCNYAFNVDDFGGYYYYAHNDFKPVMEFNTLKWRNAEGNASDNIGETIDYEKSILGKSFVYYRIDGTLYFRYSYTWVRNNKAREVQLGASNNRFKIRNKLKFIK